MLPTASRPPRPLNSPGSAERIARIPAPGFTFSDT